MIISGMYMDNQQIVIRLLIKEPNQILTKGKHMYAYVNIDSHYPKADPGWDILHWHDT